MGELNARNAALQIVADLNDRKGLQNEWDAIDEDIQAEIIDAWTDIIQRTIDAVAKDGQQGGTE